MMSRSILFGGVAESEQNLYRALGIEMSNVLDWTDDCTFLTTNRNGALVCAAGGDFNLAIDLFLFDLGEPELLSRLSSCARNGTRLALPDEKSDYPEAFFLWEDGMCRAATIEQIDDDFRILKSVMNAAGSPLSKMETGNDRLAG